jgi:hypothetical protein
MADEREDRLKGTAGFRPESSGGDNQRGRMVARDQAHWVRRAGMVVAATFLVVGIAGFIPGITTHYGNLSFAGHHSEAKLLGVFQVSVLHNIVHLLFGIIGLLVSRTWQGATYFLLGGGVVYLVLWFYGLAVGEDSSANFVPVNDADNWLHLGLALGMILLGFLGRRAAIAPGPPVEA